MDEEKNDKLRELKLKYQILAEQARDLEKQNEFLSSQAMDMAVSIQSIDELNSAEKGAEILVPLSSGVYIKANLADTKELLVNVGGNTVVRKTSHDTKSMIEEQIVEVRKLQEQLAANLNGIAAKIQYVESQIGAFTQKKQNV